MGSNQRACKYPSLVLSHDEGNDNSTSYCARNPASVIGSTGPSLPPRGKECSLVGARIFQASGMICLAISAVISTASLSLALR